MPKDVKLKEPADFKLIGKSLKRKDTPDKVNGKVVYGIDAMLPSMKFATIAACPVMGGKVANVEEGDARSIPGVRQIVVLDDLVAVVGDHMWAAKRGLSALTITWDEGPNAAVNSAANMGRPQEGLGAGGRRRKNGRRRRQGARERATGSRRHTKCRSWPTRRWSR